jgi:hypothetical protein
VLTCQCLCDEQQQLDFAFEDSFGQRVEYIIEFANEQVEEEEPEPDSEQASADCSNETGSGIRFRYLFFCDAAEQNFCLT